MIGTEVGGIRDHSDSAAASYGTRSSARSDIRGVLIGYLTTVRLEILERLP